MKLRLGLTTSAPAEKAEWIALEAERRCLEGVMVGEDLGRRQDVFTLTSILLMRTKRIKVGIGITSPLYHNITTIGRASASLYNIAPGRFSLGIGVGGLQDLAQAGIPVEKPSEALRDGTALLKAIWSGETLQHHSRHYTLQDYAYHRIEGEIPIYFGVRGPRLLQLAAELADGVIISGSRSYLSEAVRTVVKTLRAYKRRKGEFTIIAWTPTLITTGGGGLEAVKKIVATVLADTPEKALNRLPLDLESIRQVRGLVATGRKREALGLIDKSMIEELCIYGEAREVAEKLDALEALGVDEAVFGPPYGTPFKAAIEGVAEAWGHR